MYNSIMYTMCTVITISIQPFVDTLCLVDIKTNKIFSIEIFGKHPSPFNGYKQCFWTDENQLVVSMKNLSSLFVCGLFTTSYPADISFTVNVLAWSFISAIKGETIIKIVVFCFSFLFKSKTRGAAHNTMICHTQLVGKQKCLSLHESSHNTLLLGFQRRVPTLDAAFLIISFKSAIVL